MPQSVVFLLKKFSASRAAKPSGNFASKIVMMKRYTITELQQMRESEDHVEFKKGEYGNVSYNGAGKDKPKDRRKCILGYVTALCNEGGGRMVIGMRSYLDALRKDGRLQTEGKNKYMYYVLGKGE